MLHLLFLAVSTPALAADLAVVEVETTESAVVSPPSATSPSAFVPDILSEDAAAKEKKKGKDKGDNEKGGKDKGDGDKASSSDGESIGSTSTGKNKKKKKKATFLGLTLEPYVEPGGGVQIDSGDNLAAKAGADVGVRYTKDKLAGDLYIGGSYLTGEGISGYDAHLGNDLSFRDKYFGIGGGLALEYNAQTNTLTGKDIFAPSLGVKIPVEATVGPKDYYGLLGVTPAWYFDEARKPAEGQVPLGDEFEWHVAAGLLVGEFKLQAGYSMVFTSNGTYSVPVLTVGYAP